MPVGEGDEGTDACVGKDVWALVGDGDTGDATGDVVGPGVGSTGPHESTSGESRPLWPFSVAFSHAMKKAS